MQRIRVKTSEIEVEVSDELVFEKEYTRHSLVQADSLIRSTIEDVVKATKEIIEAKTKHK